MRPDKSSEESSLEGYGMFIDCSWHEVSELQILARIWLYACLGVAPLWPPSLAALGQNTAQNGPSADSPQSLFSSVVHFIAEEAFHMWKRLVVLHASLG